MSTKTKKHINIEDWITQSEAARMRKVSRQAINNLVKISRIRTLNFGGITMVFKEDIKGFEPKSPGRPKKR